ncbi:MAG: hypothetical protein JWO98_2234 [Frankiales bacterium]|nr:hypothetical protein [Frankiales bacterium]
MSQPTTPQFTDPKSAKAQAKADKAYQKASRPFYKKKRFILLAVIALIVIIVVASNSGGGGGSSSSSSSSGGGSSSGAKTVGLNQPARDGKFEFTVTGVDCSKNTIGNDPVSTKANGVFCIASLTVKNIGDQAQTLDATSQVGYDAQKRKYSTDTKSEFYLPNQGGALFNQLNPGSSVTGQIVFDVPAGTKLTKLELHDSMLSGGVDVNLG